MQPDILDFTIKLLSKCIPVKVRKFKKSTLELLCIGVANAGFSYMP